MNEPRSNSTAQPELASGPKTGAGRMEQRQSRVSEQVDPLALVDHVAELAKRQPGDPTSFVAEGSSKSGTGSILSSGGIGYERFSRGRKAAVV